VTLFRVERIRELRERVGVCRTEVVAYWTMHRCVLAKATKKGSFWEQRRVVVFVQDIEFNVQFSDIVISIPGYDYQLISALGFSIRVTNRQDLASSVTAFLRPEDAHVPL
jgi:hypothetical protein